jgi:hypothetical protein
MRRCCRRRPEQQQRCSTDPTPRHEGVQPTPLPERNVEIAAQQLLRDRTQNTPSEMTAPRKPNTASTS